MTNNIDSTALSSTVLIVDDIPANLGVAVEHLETRGYRVIIAQEGEEGLQRAAFVKPDLILLDVMMPGQDGFEICRRLKAGSKTRDIPVIFMTALSEESDKLAGFEVGGVDYITKPLHVAELLVRIDTHLKLSLMQKQLERQNRQLQQHRQALEQQVEERTVELSSSNHSLEAEIDVRQRAEVALQESERQYRSLVENTPDTIARYDPNCRRLYANPKMIEELGGDVDKILNRTPAEFPGGDSAADYEKRIRQTFADGQSADFELSWQSSGGRRIVSYIRLTPEFCANGIASVLAVGRDITEIDQYRRSMHRLAFYDALTDLPNRALLVERMRQAIGDASVCGYRFALMLVDLDRFKNINDAFGHDMGDLLLSVAAERLQHCLHDCDMVARLGGDEFAILLPQARENDDVSAMADKIVKVFEQPFYISDNELFISASMGVALYPGDSDDIDVLFRYADSAMYHAKKQGRNNFQFYIRELTAHSAERMAMEAALRYARSNNELELYYQPQVDLSTGQMTGAEALLRWNRGKDGMIAPAKFIPMAEESGLIVGIGEWVLLTACQAAVNWNTGRPIPFKIAVNLSTRQFLQNDLLASVRRILQETQCRPEWLKLEITESLLLDDSSEILDVLNAFDAMGLALSIDDFGTGYSALSYLNRFPVSQIKIDQSFVRDIPHDLNKSELVKAMIFIAQALNLELVAEGVETSEQADYLNKHGCLAVQGYLFGKPMPYAEFAALLERSEQ